MKKAYLLLVILVAFSAAFAVDVTTTGRVLMEMVTENNWSDWTDFDDATGAGNDKDCYGKGRVDLGFKAMFSENVMARINMRMEGNDDGNKWMYWGKNQIVPGNELRDAELCLQEAYIQFKGLFHQPIVWDLGRKTYNYGAKNIVSDADKLDGWRLAYEAEMFYVNLHYHILERHPHFMLEDYCVNYTLMGINGGMDNDMMDINAYFWMLGMPEDNEDKASMNVFGARGEFTLMEGMVLPFVEIAMQSGTDEAADMDYSGMLLDLGSGFKMDMGSGKFDAMVEFLMSSGDDADEQDGTAWYGVGLSNREEGYLDNDPVANNEMMIKVEAGFTPMAMEAMRVYLDFWMFNDNSKNYDDISGENLYNEIELGAEYNWMKNVKIYGAMNYGMPNKDMMGGEDAAMAFTLGSQVKW